MTPREGVEVPMCDRTCCHDDHDTQGRSPESVRGTEDNLWLLAKVAAVLAVVIALWAAGRAVGL